VRRGGSVSWLLAGLLGLATGARAEDDAFLDPGGADPLGVDPQAMVPEAPPSTPPAPAPGPSGTTPARVERSTARVEVAFVDGLAIVDVRTTFRGTGSPPGVAEDRLAIPAGAVPVAAEVCRGVAATDVAVCRPGTIGSDPAPMLDTGAPRAVVTPIDGGSALRVVAGPVSRDRALRVRVRLVVEAPVQGGMVRLVWPAPPIAPGAARPTVRVVPTGVLEPRVAGRDASHGPVPVDPGSRVAVSATIAPPPAVVATVLRTTCAGRGCARVRVEAAPRAGVSPVDLVVAIDRSASMQAVPPERVREAVDALLGALPAGSRHRRLAFGARAVELPASDLGHDAALGPSTRFDRALAVAAPLFDDRALRPVVVVVGDGGLTDVAPSREAFAAAARAGIEVDAVNVGTGLTSPALAAGVRRTGGIVLAVGAAGGDAVALERRPFQTVFAPTALPDVRVRNGRDDVHLGPLRAGGELTWLGHATPGSALEVPGAETLETIDPGGDLARFVATRLATNAAPPPAARVTFPARDLLEILRTRLLPGARGCLRRDRAGRPDYGVRAVFELSFVDRELEGADVAGAISPELRHCLLEATDSLEVPALPSRVHVRYPIATRPEPRPTPTPLPAELAAEVERVGTF